MRFPPNIAQPIGFFIDDRHLIGFYSLKTEPILDFPSCDILYSFCKFVFIYVIILGFIACIRFFCTFWLDFSPCFSWTHVLVSWRSLQLVDLVDRNPSLDPEKFSITMSFGIPKPAVGRWVDRSSVDYRPTVGFRGLLKYTRSIWRQYTISV